MGSQLTAVLGKYKYVNYCNLTYIIILTSLDYLFLSAACLRYLLIKFLLKIANSFNKKKGTPTDALAFFCNDPP